MGTQTLEDIIIRLIGQIARPIVDSMTSTADRWFYAYLIFAVLFGSLLLFRRTYDSRLGPVANLIRLSSFVLDRRVILHPSALLDYRYALLNHVVHALTIAYLIVALSGVSIIFFNIFSEMPALRESALSVGWVGALFIVVAYAFAYDTSNFFQHYLQHKIPILWEFHKVHHSAEVLTPVTAIRVHPLGFVISASVSSVVYGVLNGISFAVFAGDFAFYSILGANVFALLYYTVGLYHLKHSHIWVTFPAGIREIFASPSLHLIHHSNDPKHYDKNFGFVFTFWDRIFGTFYSPADHEQRDLVLGISEAEGRSEYLTVSDLYLTPFRRAWAYHLRPALFRQNDPARANHHSCRMASDPPQRRLTRR